MHDCPIGQSRLERQLVCEVPEQSQPEARSASKNAIAKRIGPSSPSPGGRTTRAPTLEPRLAPIERLRFRAPMRSRVLALAVLASCVGACAAGCSDGDFTTVDARFSTPEHTVQTLLGAFGVRELSQEQIRAQLATQGSFRLQNRVDYEACFTDFAQPGGEGLAGYVLGMLAAAKDELRYETFEDYAYVFPREGVRVVMRREAGAYRIVLRESVPDEVRRGLIGVEAAAEERARLGTPLGREQGP